MAAVPSSYHHHQYGVVWCVRNGRAASALCAIFFFFTGSEEIVEFFVVSVVIISIFDASLLVSGRDTCTYTHPQLLVLARFGLAAGRIEKEGRQAVGACVDMSKWCAAALVLFLLPEWDINPAGLLGGLLGARYISMDTPCTHCCCVMGRCWTCLLWVKSTLIVVMFACVLPGTAVQP